MNGRKSWPGRWLPVLALIFVLPAVAEAHMDNLGMGDFFNGLAHPLMTPAHVLIMLALGLGLAQRTPTDFKTPMFVFMPFCAAALLFTTTGMVTTVYPPILISIALCAGFPVVFEKSLSPWPCRALFAVAATAIGLDSAAGTASAATVTKNLCGTWLCLVVLTFDLGAYLSRCTNRKWVRVGIRVMGSWITAISLLVLAFFLKR